MVPVILPKIVLPCCSPHSLIRFMRFGIMDAIAESKPFTVVLKTSGTAHCANIVAPIPRGFDANICNVFSSIISASILNSELDKDVFKRLFTYFLYAPKSNPPLEPITFPISPSFGSSSFFPFLPRVACPILS